MKRKWNEMWDFKDYFHLNNLKVNLIEFFSCHFAVDENESERVPESRN